jgi:hypothetical protein
MLKGGSKLVVNEIPIGVFQGKVPQFVSCGTRKLSDTQTHVKLSSNVVFGILNFNIPVAYNDMEI